MPLRVPQAPSLPSPAAPNAAPAMPTPKKKNLAELEATDPDTVAQLENGLASLLYEPNGTWCVVKAQNKSLGELLLDMGAGHGRGRSHYRCDQGVACKFLVALADARSPDPPCLPAQLLPPLLAPDPTLLLLESRDASVLDRMREWALCRPLPASWRADEATSPSLPFSLATMLPPSVPPWPDVPADASMLDRMREQVLSRPLPACYADPVRHRAASALQAACRRFRGRKVEASLRARRAAREPKNRQRTSAPTEEPTAGVPPQMVPMVMAWMSGAGRKSQKKEAEGVSPTFTLFYNIYVPPDSKDRPRARHILKEQLDMVKNATHLSGMTVRYAVIDSTGSPIPMPCERGQCTLLAHAQVGDESITLQPLFEHCVAHPSETVIYLHSKGSYHPSRANNLLRRALTRAALSPECTTLRQSVRSACDICGLEFRPRPQATIPGNMWTADCAHIARLLSPLEFSRQVTSLIADANASIQGAAWRSRGDAWQFDRASWTAMDRFSNEYWALSHPQTKPCDVRGFAQMVLVQKASSYMVPKDPNWHLHRLTALERNITSKDGGVVSHPWFSLHGRQHQWGYLYHQQPSADSWVWNAYKRSNGYQRGLTWVPKGTHMGTKGAPQADLPGPSGPNKVASGTLREHWAAYSEKHKLDRYLDYAEHYERYLPKRDALGELRMLEFGVQSGGSARTWKSWYKDRLYYTGVDIDTRCKRSHSPREHIFIEIGSQLDTSFLQHVCKKHGPFDVVIDDGGHTAEMINVSLSAILSPANACMKGNALYVIEDTHTMLTCLKEPSWYCQTPRDIHQIFGEMFFAMHSKPPFPGALAAPDFGQVGKYLLGLHAHDSIIFLERTLHARNEQLTRVVLGEDGFQNKEKILNVAARRPVGHGGVGSQSRRPPMVMPSESKVDQVHSLALKPCGSAGFFYKPSQLETVWTTGPAKHNRICEFASDEKHLQGVRLWLNYSQRPHGFTAGPPDPDESNSLSWLHCSSGLLEPIEPLTGTARHPGFPVGCDMRMRGANSQVSLIDRIRPARTLLYDITYLVLQNGCTKMQTPSRRNVFFDLGSSMSSLRSARLDQGDGKFWSVELFYRLYRRNCIDFTHIYAWEAEKLDRDAYWRNVPAYLQGMRPVLEPFSEHPAVPCHHVVLLALPSAYSTSSRSLQACLPPV